MDLDTLTTMLLDFTRAHQNWALFIVGALAFAESLAVVSLLVPSTVLLLGIGALIAASGLEGTVKLLKKDMPTPARIRLRRRSQYQSPQPRPGRREHEHGDDQRRWC
jgi:hypothetical protein